MKLKQTMFKRNITLWTLSLLITLLAAYYQRTTGPTVPKKISMQISEENEKFVLNRTHVSDSDCPVELTLHSDITEAKLWYKRIPTQDKWQFLPMKKNNDTLKAALPKQPASGKVAYYIEINTGDKTYFVSKEKPVVVRYKGDVPAWVLIPHIILIFLAMLFANYAGINAIFKVKKIRPFVVLTVLFLFFGGMVFGPIVQKFAFNAYWTGVPFGWDLTDNKTLIAMFFWLFALGVNIKKERPYAVIIAAVVTIFIFSIPHSMFGSQLDYTSGVVTQG